MRNRVTAVALVTALLLGLALLSPPPPPPPRQGHPAVRPPERRQRGARARRPRRARPRFVTLAGDRACFALQWSKIGAPTAAHIHEGGAGVAGPIVVLFFQPGTNAASLPDTLSSVAGCVDVDPALARRIADHPRDFYVNIHTADFAAGAIRGQLHRSRHLDLDLPHQLSARLNGASEVPGPGDPDGRGLALVKTGRERVCFALAWTRIAPPIFAHIHAGPAGSPAQSWSCSSTCLSRRRADGRTPGNHRRGRRLRRRSGPSPAPRHPPPSRRLLRQHPQPRVRAGRHPRPAPQGRVGPGGGRARAGNGPQRGPSVARATLVAEKERSVYHARMPRVSQEYRDARRREILEAARRHFAENGFHSTSMQDFFEASGLSAGLVYRYFRSKEGLITALAGGALQLLHASVEEAIAAGERPGTEEVVARLLRTIDEARRPRADRPRRRPGLGGGAGQPGRRVGLRGRDRPSQAALERLVAVAQAAGQLDRDLEPAYAARAVRDPARLPPPAGPRPGARRGPLPAGRPGADRRPPAPLLKRNIPS